jgi:hypothetical protein
MESVLDEPEVAEDQQEQEPEAVASEPVVVPPAPPADSPAYFREHYDAIREKERDVYALENEYLELKEEAAGAKKAFEAADKELRNLIARGPDRQKKLPLDEAEATPRKPKRIKLLADIEGTTLKVGYEPPFEIDGDGDVAAIWNDGTTDQKIHLEPDEFEVIEWTNGDEGQPEAQESDAWRAAPLSELGLTLKQNDLFEAIGVTTIGHMEDLRARIAEGKPDAQWPKGIGPAKVTDIESRIIDWLDRNRDKFGEPVPVGEADQPVVPGPSEPETVHANGNGKAKQRKLKGGL